MQCEEKNLLDTETVLDQEAFHNAEAPASWDSKLSEIQSFFDWGDFHPESCSVAVNRVYLNKLLICRKALLGIKTSMLYLHCCKGVGLFHPSEQQMLSMSVSNNNSHTLFFT